MIMPTRPPDRSPRSHPNCPRCRHPHVHRWGHSCGRQRYRCLGCGRTYSTFTATPLHYLKRIDLWEEHRRLMVKVTTIREAARQLGLDKMTAFRWRHRVLPALDRLHPPNFRDHVAVDEILFQQRRGVGGGARQWLIILRDQRGSALSRAVGAGPVRTIDLVEFVTDHVAAEAVLIGGRGPYSRLAGCARRTGRGYRKRFPEWASRTTLEPASVHAHRICSWLRPFRGVAFHYLTRYVAWFHALEPPVLERLGVVPWSAGGVASPLRS